MRYWCAIPYVGTFWFIKLGGGPEYRFDLWTEACHRSRSRRGDLYDCEPAQERLPVRGGGCALGRGTHGVAADHSRHRLVVANCDSGESQWMAGGSWCPYNSRARWAGA